MSDVEACGFINGAVVPVDGGGLWGEIPTKRGARKIRRVAVTRYRSRDD